MQVSINVNDDLISDFGIIYIQEFLQKQLELHELQISANKITKYLQSNDSIDWEKELDIAREEAWNEYKTKFTNKDK